MRQYFLTFRDSPITLWDRHSPLLSLSLSLALSLSLPHPFSVHLICRSDHIYPPQFYCFGSSARIPMLFGNQFQAVTDSSTRQELSRLSVIRARTEPDLKSWMRGRRSSLNNLSSSPEHNLSHNLRILSLLPRSLKNRSGLKIGYFIGTSSKLLFPMKRMHELATGARFAHPLD